MAPISHIPWVMPLLRLIPSRDVKVVQDFGRRMAVRRIEAGSKNKDLFYYLVSRSHDVGWRVVEVRLSQTGEDVPEGAAESFEVSLEEVKSDGLLGTLLHVLHPSLLTEHGPCLQR